MKPASVPALRLYGALEGATVERVKPGPIKWCKRCHRKHPARMCNLTRNDRGRLVQR